MKFKANIELRHVSGPEQSEDVMIDAFAGTIGRQNAAPTPLRIETGAGWDDDTGDPITSVYEVDLVS